MREMPEFEQALDEVLSHIEVLETESIHVSDCLGQVIAEDVYAGIDVPPQDVATMDGYAVRAADVRGACQNSPRRLRVTDTACAGEPARHEVSEGTAVRIMTGAPLPAGADSVVIFENTREAEQDGCQGFIEVLKEAGTGSNVLGAGGHIAKGSLLVSKGTVVKPTMISLLASSGRASVMSIHQPVVAIIATGEELVEPEEPLLEGQVYNSNIYGLAASVQRCGGIAEMIGIAGDSEADITRCIRRGLDADTIITSGGSSKGDRDYIKPILARMGEIIFSRVNMTPGMPFTFGFINDHRIDGCARSVPLFALPGSPSGCFVSFEVFVRPAILKMAGKSRLTPPKIEARISEDIVRRKDNIHFRWVKVERQNGEYIASPSYEPGGGILASMAHANGMVIIPKGKKEISSRDKVEVLILDWQEENLI